MQTPHKKPNIIERFLYGPQGDPQGKKDLTGQAFPIDPYQNLTRQNWSSPVVPMNPQGTYGGRVNYLVEAGDLIDNSAVMACMNWLMRNIPKATPRVVLPTEDGIQPVKNHPFNAILKRPNAFYSGTQLLRGTVCSYYWDGNAYWRKVRNGMGQVIGYWYEPHWTIRPWRDNAEDYVSYYQIWRNREWIRIEVEDIVHFRWGFSAYDQKLGMAPLASALRDVFTDNEAARYSSTMFRNLGVIGGIVSSGSEDLPINNPEMLKAELQALTTGDERGKWLVQDVPLDFNFPNTDPGKMNTRENRKISEERVAALLGVPASVAGLGAGLDRNTYNNADDAIRRAYDDNIIPTLAGWAEEIDIQTLPDFTNVAAETVEFDVSKISVLQGDINAIEASASLLYKTGVITRAQAKLKISMTPAADGSDDVYFTDLAVLRASLATPPPTQEDDIAGSPQADALTGLPPAPPPAKALTNGNGHSH